MKIDKIFMSIIALIFVCLITWNEILEINYKKLERRVLYIEHRESVIYEMYRKTVEHLKY